MAEAIEWNSRNSRNVVDSLRDRHQKHYNLYGGKKDSFCVCMFVFYIYKLAFASDKKGI